MNHDTRARLVLAHLRVAILAALYLLVSAWSVNAQTTVTVLGTGNLAFDIIGITPLEANAQKYRVYLPATASIGQVSTVSCTGSGTTSLCMLSLTQLPLTSTAQSLAVSAAKTAADGEVESPKAVAPFVLLKAGLPVAPVFSATPIRPATP